MNRLLAKLPRSSSGSRELSASSSAAAFPADIFEVSITGVDPDLAEDSLPPVSALICSGGASSGDFISLAGTMRFCHSGHSLGISHCLIVRDVSVRARHGTSPSDGGPDWHIRST